MAVKKVQSRGCFTGKTGIRQPGGEETPADPVVDHQERPPEPTFGNRPRSMSATQNRVQRNKKKSLGMHLGFRCAKALTDARLSKPRRLRAGGWKCLSPAHWRAPPALFKTLRYPQIISNSPFLLICSCLPFIHLSILMSTNPINMFFHCNTHNRKAWLVLQSFYKLSL